MVPRGATGWLVPFLVLAAGLLVGGLLIVMDGAPGRTAAATDALPAKVVASTPCGPQEARDTVQVVVDGRSQRLALDGCGNPVGTELQVELLSEGPTARLAGTGHNGSGGPAEKISLLLLVLAGLAGALFTMVVRWRPRP
ncbi:MAG TPA: hypothetical protein VFM37_05860 [Pseudonocardiaceae bacterium]|nr:hypothetical protein [Pseudonocardiaceae bacterium]